MGAHDLQEFIDKFCPNACVNVNIGDPAWRRKVVGSQFEPIYLVIDADSCLHRLYGGSYTDWVCGGQWNQMYHFVKCFCMAAERANIEMTIYFNGALEKQRIQEWTKKQNTLKENIRKIINHTYKRDVFKNCSDNVASKTKRLKDSVNHYQSATRNGGKFMESLKQQSTSVNPGSPDDNIAHKHDVVEISSLKTSGSTSPESETRFSCKRSGNADVSSGSSKDGADTLLVDEFERKLKLEKDEEREEARTSSPTS
uniref:Uncharacterized protein n=1 Tax=Ciona savignyi TaxID=51511 RepID=H2Z6S7_CIOSA